MARSTEDHSQDVLSAGPNRTSEIKERPFQEGEEAPTHAGNLLEEIRSRLEERVAAGTRRVGENLRRFGEQGVALANGRPQYALDLSEFVRHMAEEVLEAADVADALADDVRWRGTGRLLWDIGGVARRRPRFFILVSAAAALFAAAGVAPHPLSRAEGEPEPEDGAVRDQLEPAVLDALLRAMWPGDGERGSPAAGGQRTVRSGQKR